MDEINKAFRKRFLLAAICGGLVLLTLGLGLMQQSFSSRGFTIAVLVWCAAMIAAFAFLVRQHQIEVIEYRIRQANLGFSVDTLDRERCLKSIRNLKRLIAAMVLLLLAGLWATRKGSMTPRLSGVAANLFITGPAIYSLIQLRKKLKRQ